MKHVQGVHGFAGGHHVAFIGAEIDHGIVLDHKGNIDQLLQLGVQVLLHLGQQAGVAVGNFLAVAVRKKGTGKREKHSDRQKEHERIGKNIAIEGPAFAFHLSGRLFGDKAFRIAS